MAQSETMRTDEKQYSDYLEAKYLPGRSLYLRCFFYPKLFRAFPGTDTIIDLGCGTGEFLRNCKTRNRAAVGIDSNETLANRCRREGFQVQIDSICDLLSLKGNPFRYAVCDNVLEHLEIREISRFFERIDELLLPRGTLICIVPGVKGFQKDPTHKTYVSLKLLNSLLKNSRLKVQAFYYHPFNLPRLDKYFYLNMQVFEIRKTSDAAAQTSRLVGEAERTQSKTAEAAALCPTRPA